MLKISLLGHRKRIIASLAERPYEEPPVKPPRLSQIRVSDIKFNLNFILRVCQAKIGKLLVSKGGMSLNRAIFKSKGVALYSDIPLLIS